MEKFKWEYATNEELYEDMYGDTIKTIITLDKDYLSAAIDEKAFLDWSYISPVFLYAATGTGKTTLFEDIAITLIKNKLRVLVLSNRSAVDLAFKRRLLKKMNKTYILDRHTSIGLNDLTELDDYLFVMTYQRLSKLIDDNNSEFHKIHFDLVICDEIAFIYDDAMLINTSKIISYIVEHFSFSVRCYASATPDPTFKYIYDLENYYYNKREYYCVLGRSCHGCSLTKLNGLVICDGKSCINKCRWATNDVPTYHDTEKKFYPIVYKMVKGYGYVRLHFLNNYDEIVKMIKDGKLKFKVIIFFDTKNNGKTMESDLPDAIYIDASTKYLNAKDIHKETYDYIIEHETFKQKVLLCSTTFDCGINLKYNTGIHNIVISTADPNKFKQMLGRIRVNKGDIVDLYIVDMSINDLKDQLEVVKRKLGAINNYYKNKRKFADDYFNDSTSKYKYPLVQGTFYVKINGIEFNEASEIHLSYLKEVLENIITGYKNGDRQAYIKNVLKWLGREDDYSEDKWVNYRSSDELYVEFIEFLQKYDGTRFIKNDGNFMKFRIEFQTLFNKLVLGKNISISEDDKKHIWGDKIINNHLASRGFNFMLEKNEDYILFRRISSNIIKTDLNNETNSMEN